MARASSNPPADDGEGFLSRWSRRKVEERAASDVDREPDGVAAVEASASAQVPGPAASPGAPPEIVAPSPPPEPLPSIESLTAESDYRIFLRPGVPDGVQRDALRRLWATVPGLAPIEVAEAHMGDFNAVPTFPEGLKETIYDVVRGFVDRAAEPEADVPSEAGAVSACAEPPAVDSPGAEAAPEPSSDQVVVEDSTADQSKPR